MTARMALKATAGLVLLLLAAPLSAQEMAAGIWSGTVSPPDDAPFDVTYEVSYGEEGELQITLFPPQGLGAPPEIPFNEVELEEGVLTFSWFAGVDLTCELVRQEDGVFEGECIDAGGTPGILVMVPPDGG
jgi:hypothetical protein